MKTGAALLEATRSKRKKIRFTTRLNDFCKFVAVTK